VRPGIVSVLICISSLSSEPVDAAGGRALRRDFPLIAGILSRKTVAE
jgi:hypothetical protein